MSFFGKFASTLSSTPAGTTIGLKERECGQMGVIMMAGTLGWIMEAPAATAYAVLPVGVETITPEWTEMQKHIFTEAQVLNALSHQKSVTKGKVQPASLTDRHPLVILVQKKNFVQKLLDIFLPKIKKPNLCSDSWIT